MSFKTTKNDGTLNAGVATRLSAGREDTRLGSLGEVLGIRGLEEQELFGAGITSSENNDQRIGMYLNSFSGLSFNMIDGTANSGCISFWRDYTHVDEQIKLHGLEGDDV
jgi:hypothetical protein